MVDALLRLPRFALLNRPSLHRVTQAAPRVHGMVLRNFSGPAWRLENAHGNDNALHTRRAEAHSHLQKRTAPASNITSMIVLLHRPAMRTTRGNFARQQSPDA